MTKDNPCKHDLMGILHCKKCGEQYHVDWLEALRQTKVEAVGEILTRMESTIKMKAQRGEVRDKATKIALKALEEVKDVYDEVINNKTFFIEKKKSEKLSS